VSSRSPATPYLSVVTPLYNCLPLTHAMVKSLQASIPSWLSYEVILVDDGSTDGTREWLSGLGAPFRVVLNEANVGFGASTNRGAALARGRVLALLNNDLVLRRGWLGPMLWTLRLLGWKAGLVGNIQLNATTLQVDHAGVVVNNENCKPEHDREAPSLAALLVRPVRLAFAVTGACVLVRASTFHRLGGFDEGYRNGCEDVDLCLRAREAGLVNAVVLHSRVLHHVSASPGRKLRDEQNSQRLFLKWRDRLAEEASRERALEDFLSVLPDPRDFPDPLEAIRTALYLLHVRREPPATAVAVKQKAIDLELARWQKMFSP
jgi:GT2 family glycosyltransferase